MRLPPLNALKAFEAAARLGSFVAASEELGVSAAAVSMQVRNLETYLKKKLFTRSNNRITLTDAGMAIYPGTAQSLSGIASLTERILDPETRSRIVVSTLPSLAERWLVPRLADFARAEPGPSVELRIEDDPVEFARDKIGVRITFGDHLYPEFRSDVLFRDTVTPLMAPGVAIPFEDERDLLHVADDSLIHVDWGPKYGSQPRWSDWFETAGSARTPDITKGTSVTTTSAAIALATRGMGVALAPRSLAAAELASGVLIAPSPVNLILSHPYCAISSHTPQSDRYLRRFIDWLVRDDSGNAAEPGRRVQNEERRQ